MIMMIIKIRYFSVKDMEMMMTMRVVTNNRHGNGDDNVQNFFAPGKMSALL